MLEIGRFLCLSTAHLPQGVYEKLFGYRGPYGTFVYVPKRGRIEGVPSSLVNVLTFARGKGVDYVLFDEDGPEIKCLPKWKW